MLMVTPSLAAAESDSPVIKLNTIASARNNASERLLRI
jgi:hypothetical protein